MIKSNLWDINSINVKIISSKFARIEYKRFSDYHTKEVVVELNFIDSLLGTKITQKVTNKIKSLIVELEKENNEINELIKWEEEFKTKGRGVE